jgi:hypothetical protein
MHIWTPPGDFSAVHLITEGVLKSLAATGGRFDDRGDRQWRTGRIAAALHWWSCRESNPLQKSLYLRER